MKHRILGHRTIKECWEIAKVSAFWEDGEFTAKDYIIALTATLYVLWEERGLLRKSEPSEREQALFMEAEAALNESEFHQITGDHKTAVACIDRCIEMIHRSSEH